MSVLASLNVREWHLNAIIAATLLKTNKELSAQSMNKWENKQEFRAKQLRYSAS